MFYLIYDFCPFSTGESVSPVIVVLVMSFMLCHLFILLACIIIVHIHPLMHFPIYPPHPAQSGEPAQACFDHIRATAFSAVIAANQVPGWGWYLNHSLTRHHQLVFSLECTKQCFLVSDSLTLILISIILII